jgi:hypothetical protein
VPEVQGKAGSAAGKPLHDQDLKKELIPPSRGSTEEIVKRDLKRGSMPLLFYLRTMEARRLD